MPERRRRGAQLVRAERARLRPGTCIPKQELFGRIIGAIRRTLLVSQQQLAEELRWPASLISKMEIGQITFSLHHLDALATAFTRIERRDRPDSPAWSGLELYGVLEGTARAIEAAGYVMLWNLPDDAEERGLLVEDREIALLVRDHLAPRGTA